MANLQTLLLGLLGLCALACVVDTVRAQQPDEPSRELAAVKSQTLGDHPSATVVQALGSGARLRIQTAEWGRWEGRIAERWRDSLLLVTERIERRVPIAAIDTLWVRRRSAKGGALAGGMVGFFIAVFPALILYQGCTSDFQACVEVIPGRVLRTGLPAVIVGALVGALLPRWERKYP